MVTGGLKVKRYACAVLALTLLPAFVFGMPTPTKVGALAGNDARSMGMGGSSLVFSSGYDSFFGNPAGFADKGTLTLGDVSFWGSAPLAEETLNSYFAIQEKYANETRRDEMMDGMLEDNGRLGLGASIGLGWAGGGFGLGLTMISDLALSGSSYAESRLVVRNQLNATVGFGIPIRLGFVTIRAGADLRGFYRLDSPASSGWDAYSLVNAAMGYSDNLDSLIDAGRLMGGFGWAFDAGISLRAGPFMAGFMGRDLFARLNMDIADIGDMRAGGGLPTEPRYGFSMDPTYTAGVGLRFMEKGLFSPSFYAQASDLGGLMSAFESEADRDSLLGFLRAGAELRLLRIFLFRGGLDGGLLSFGAGIDLALIRVDAAVYALPFEGLAGGSSGLAVRAAVKL